MFTSQPIKVGLDIGKHDDMHGSCIHDLGQLKLNCTLNYVMATIIEKFNAQLRLNDVWSSNINVRIGVCKPQAVKDNFINV